MLRAPPPGRWPPPRNSPAPTAEWPGGSAPWRNEGSGRRHGSSRPRPASAGGGVRWYVCGGGGWGMGARRRTTRRRLAHKVRPRNACRMTVHFTGWLEAQDADAFGQCERPRCRAHLTQPGGRGQQRPHLSPLLEVLVGSSSVGQQDRGNGRRQAGGCRAGGEAPGRSGSSSPDLSAGPCTASLATRARSCTQLVFTHKEPPACLQGKLPAATAGSLRTLPPAF